MTILYDFQLNIVPGMIFVINILVHPPLETWEKFLRRIGVEKKIRGKNQDSSFEVGLIGYE